MVKFSFNLFAKAEPLGQLIGRPGHGDGLAAAGGLLARVRDLGDGGGHPARDSQSEQGSWSRDR